ncbi:MAG: hypothetical protein KAX81_06675, partial [Leadbetterella sp.]|nr:hypothetical protein [Leadbetterella sp.]
MKKKVVYIFIFIILTVGVGNIFASKTSIIAQYGNKNDYIKTILLYGYSPNDNFNERYNNAAVINRSIANSN